MRITEKIQKRKDEENAISLRQIQYIFKKLISRCSHKELKCVRMYTLLGTFSINKYMKVVLMKKTREPSLASRLKIWREHLGLTAKDFAAMTGVGLSALKKYEANTAMPGSEALIAIGKSGVNIHWLLIGVGNMTTTPTRTLEDIIQDMIKEPDSYKREIILNELFLRIRSSTELKELNEVFGKLLTGYICLRQPQCEIVHLLHH